MSGYYIQKAKKKIKMFPPSEYGESLKALADYLINQKLTPQRA